MNWLLTATLSSAAKVLEIKGPAAVSAFEPKNALCFLSFNLCPRWTEKGGKP